MSSTTKRRNPYFEQHQTPSDDQITSVLKIMSHDIRGSLLSISAKLTLLSRGYYGKLDDRIENQLKEVSQRVTGLIEVFEEYLRKTYSIKNNREIEQEMLDLKKDIIDPVLEELSPEIKDHQIVINHGFGSMAGRPLPLKTNKVWLKAVFRNLLKNAIQYGGTGCTITLGFEDHGASCQLNVYNSGTPIPANWQDCLFTKFPPRGYYGNESSSGMGLGLYLIKNLIRKHGGDIWYEAKEHGSNFIFTIPVVANQSLA